MYNSDMEKIMRKYSSKRITRGRAIKLYCKEMCCAGDYQSWANCTFKSCFLNSFRMGKEIIQDNKNKSSNVSIRTSTKENTPLQKEEREKNGRRNI